MYCFNLRNCLNLLRNFLYNSSFGNFEVLSGCFRQVSAVKTDRFLPSQLAEPSQKLLSKFLENKFKQFLKL